MRKRDPDLNDAPPPILEGAERRNHLTTPPPPVDPARVAAIDRLGDELLTLMDPVALRAALNDLNFRLVYDPSQKVVTGEFDLSASTRCGSVRVGGESASPGTRVTVARTEFDAAA